MYPNAKSAYYGPEMRVRRSYSSPRPPREDKQTGYNLSSDRRQIIFIDGFKAGTFDLWCSRKTLMYYSNQQIKRVRVVKGADGYYCQFLINWERKEQHEFSGQIVGIDVGLKEFYTDSNGHTNGLSMETLKV